MASKKTRLRKTPMPCDRSGTTEQEMKETRKERREGYEKVTGDRQEDTKKETGIGI